MDDIPKEPNEEPLQEEGDEVLRRVKSFWLRLAILAACAFLAVGYLVFKSYGVSGLITASVVVVLVGVVIRWGILPRF